MRYALEHGAGLTGSAILNRDVESRAEPAGDRGGTERPVLAKEGKARPAHNSHAEWSVVERGQIARMLKQEMSASEIAAHFRVSRNAIIGIVHRDQKLKAIGFAKARGPLTDAQKLSIKANRKQGGIKGGVPGKKLVEARQKAKNIQRGEPRAAEGRQAPVSKPEAPLHGREGREAPAGTAAPLMLSLVDLTSQTCKWPVGDPHEDDFGFCGQNTRAKSPYCQRHHDRAYTRPERVEA